MFLSQNNLMGRANILYHLLRRGIVTSRWVTWAKNITRKSQHDLGNWQYTLIAIYTMFANKGYIPLAEFLKSLIDKKEPARRFAKQILANTNESIVIPIVSKLLLGQIVNFEKSELLTNI
jgi:hypothetical protein